MLPQPKCSFMTDYVMFLGYVVLKNRLSVDESKVVAIKAKAIANPYYLECSTKFLWVGVFFTLLH